MAVGSVMIVKRCSWASAVTTVLQGMMARRASKKRVHITGVPTPEIRVRSFPWTEREGTAGATGVAFFLDRCLISTVLVEGAKKLCKPESNSARQKATNSYYRAHQARR